jgi:hypothetical protein
MEVRFSRHARNKMRLYKLTEGDVAAVLSEGERLPRGDRWESRLGKLRVIWANIGTYAFVVTVIRIR